MDGSFRRLPPVLRSHELLDKAFSRASRAGRGKKDVRKAQESMILTAGNILADNLRNIVVRFPNFDELHPFHRELVDLSIGVDRIKKSLGRVYGASKQIRKISREGIASLRDARDPVSIRKMVFGRMASMVEEIEDALEILLSARELLRKMIVIEDLPSIIVAGYPNVGKSSLVSRMSSAKPEIASYPFTTKEISIGHFWKDGMKYQIFDLPGILDRDESEMNEIERRALAALKHLEGVILFIVDPTESCGFSLEEQMRLYEKLKQRFPRIVLAYSKRDIMRFGEPSFSSLTGEGIEELRNTLVSMLKEEASKKKSGNGSSVQKGQSGMSSFS
ncbi:MAG: nucleolar GTP-binding protein [Archaeoglobi archaeon]|nr:50S ribosome-binding GTPase [Candidatus Mnemosynella bozhongmuii]MDK2782272.1 nucleolar GTP-binding protein [Archaeoglobi archaeon]